MSVTNQTPANSFTANGVTTVFNFTFQVLDSSDLHVQVDGQDMVIGSEYSVSGVGEQSGGSVEFVVAPAVGKRVVMYRESILKRESDYQNNGDLRSATLNNDLDRLWLVMQEILYKYQLAPRLSAGSTNAGAVKLPDPGAGKFLRWNLSGTNLELSDGTGVSPGDFIQSGTGAVARSIQSKLGESITADDFGAYGDNVTNDSLCFALLESAHKGKSFDLRGRTYLVTSVPDGAQYYNGAFRVGSSIYPLPKSPLAHPLDGDAVAIAEGKVEHYWPGPVGQPTNDDILLGAYITAWRHTASVGSPLLCGISYDGGITWEEARTIYSSATNEPRGLVGGMVTGTRFGVMFVLVDSAGNITGTRFAYTDDNAANWTTVTIASTAFYPHGEYVFDDSGGINVYGYGGGNIYRARSTNNGTSWTVTLVTSASAPMTMPVEPAVVKLATGKYLMLARDDAGGNAKACTSVNGGTWSAWQDTNLPLGTNPPLLVVAWGRLWAYLCARRSTPINGYEDKLLVAELDPDAIFSAGGAISGPSALRVAMAGKTAMIGYLTVCRLLDGRHIGYLVDGETLTGSANPAATRLVRLGGHRPVLAAPALLTLRRTQPPITHNSSFGHWTRGTSFLAISSTVATADRWLIARTGTNVDVTRVDVPDAIRRALTFRGRYALNIVGDGSGSGRFFMQRFFGRDRIAPMLDRPITINSIIGGTLPGYFIARVVLNFGTGGSATQIISVNAAQRSIVGDLTLITATLYTPNADGATWGTDPYIQITLISNDAGACNANVYAIWADWGDRYIPLDPMDQDEERAVLDKYCSKQTWGAFAHVGVGRGQGTAVVQVALQYPEMVAVPSLSASAASNLRIGGTACTAQSFGTTSNRQTLLDATMGSGTVTSGDAALCSVVSGGSWSLTADVGY